MYSKHHSTKILCLAFKIPSSYGVNLWVPGDSIPESLLDFIHYEPYGCFEAHNALFELAIYENIMVPVHGFPPIQRERWTCSAAKGSTLNLPRKLEALGAALRLPVLKDMEGHKIMMKMSKPRKPTKNNPSIWHDDPEDYEKLYAYCIQDVEAEECASNLMSDLIPREKEIYLLDQKINLRGLPIDRSSVNNALNFIEEFSSWLIFELVELTDGEIDSPGQVKRMKEWLADRGLELPGLAADIVKDALERDDLSDEVRRLLELRKALGKSSVNKLKAFINMADSDDRIRGTLRYHGAGTGRWAGVGIQPHNFPRGVIKDIPLCIELLEIGDYELFLMFYDDVMGAISSCIRGMIKAPKGKKFYAADFSSIESRVLFWLAGEENGLQIYHTHGLVYEDMASFIFQKPIKSILKGSQERFVGKEAVLGCGYQMGGKRFHKECHEKGAKWITRDMAEKAVQAFRSKYQKVVRMWYAQNGAAIKAVKSPGTIVECGMVRWKVIGRFLYCRLPSGRRLAYCEPVIEQTITDYGVKDQLTYMTVNSKTKKWNREKTYGGKLVENITQGVARDFMAEAMLRVEEKDYGIILTVHDEIMSEIDENFGDLKEFEKLMSVVPKWGKGCPVAVEGWEGKRFKK